MEKIRQYYADELDEAESNRVEGLIETDQQFAAHHKLFRAANKGIRQTLDPQEKDWMRRLDQADLDTGQKVALKRLKKK